MVRLDLWADAPVVRVALSRRNLLALLAKLSQPGSARTITGGYCYLDGALVDLTLVLVAEPDELHYAEREPAGVMHADTEAAVARTEADVARTQARAEHCLQGTRRAHVRRQEPWNR